MIAEFSMASLARSLDPVHRSLQLRRLQRLAPGSIDQFTGHALQLPGKVMEPRLTLPHLRSRAAVTTIARLGEVLPRLVRGEALVAHRSKARAS